MAKLFSKLVMMIAALFMSVAVMADNHSYGNNANGDKDMMKMKSTVVTVAAGNKDFSTLVTAIKAAGLVKALSGKGPFTVFAPDNAAFAQLPKGTLEKLLENKQQLRAILTYHVVPGKITSDEIKSGKVKALDGKMLTITKTDDGVMVNGAKVTQADIMAGNGVIHVINKVLMPPKN